MNVSVSGIISCVDFNFHVHLEIPGMCLLHLNQFKYYVQLFWK